MTGTKNQEGTFIFDIDHLYQAFAAMRKNSGSACTSFRKLHIFNTGKPTNLSGDSYNTPSNLNVGDEYNMKFIKLAASNGYIKC